ncbi:MAG: hypothetical protein HY899_19615 [Deltaproteobacteria bacterium]|nr:hypothetical protein [Deltaproteobacteria bacterium]
MTVFVAAAALSATITACERGSSDAPRAAPPPLPPVSAGFVDITKAAGIDFVHSFGDDKFSNLVEAVGAGGAWLDYDQDGLLDLYIATGKYNATLSKGDPPKEKPLNRLYRGLADGTPWTRLDLAERLRAGVALRLSRGFTSARASSNSFVVSACGLSRHRRTERHGCDLFPRTRLYRHRLVHLRCVGWLHRPQSRDRDDHRHRPHLRRRNGRRQNYGQRCAQGSSSRRRYRYLL